MRSIILLALALSAGAASAAPTPESALRAALVSTDPVAARQLLVSDPTLTDERLSLLAHNADWRVRLEAQVVLTWRQDPGLAQNLWEAAPGMTRAELARFGDPIFRQAHSAPMLLDRYLHGGGDAIERGALVEALPRTGGDWEEALVSIVSDETDPGVKGIMLECLKKVDTALAAPVLRAGLRDASPEVRASAARTMGWTDEPATYGADLQRAFGDRAALVRSAAVRAAGWLRVEGAWTGLVTRLSDEDAEVRLHALRALERIDAPRAGQLSQVGALVTDPDAKVARAAGQIAGR